MDKFSALLMDLHARTVSAPGHAPSQAIFSPLTAFARGRMNNTRRGASYVTFGGWIMRLDMMRMVVVGLWLAGVTACNKDDGGGGGLEALCEKVAACGGSPAQECVDQFKSCAAAEAKANECAGMSSCEAVLGCFVPVIFECLPEGSSSDGTFGSTSDDTVTPTTGGTTGGTAEPTSGTTEPETGTGSSGEASSSSSGDTGDDEVVYGPCADGEPQCPGDAICANTDAGRFCAPKCEGNVCPPNPVMGAEAMCVLTTQGGMNPEYCALICDPKLPNTQCPNGLVCKEVPFQDFGVCAE